MNEIQNSFKVSLLGMNRYDAHKILSENLSSMDIIEQLIVPVLEEIGDGWETGDYSLSQVYMSGVITEELVEKYFDQIERRDDKLTSLKCGIVTFDDYHTLGKRIVYMHLKAQGFDILDFGMIFDESDLIKKVKENNIDVLFMSVLMLPPALRIKEIKPKLLEVNPNIKIVVGGAPFRFDRNLYKEIGADATGANAFDAIEYLRSLGGE
jgi:methanogenic corrinoid protein MtbC1